MIYINIISWNVICLLYISTSPCTVNSIFKGWRNSFNNYMQRTNILL